MELKNFHTHSTFCDGKNTLEEMTVAAIEQGFTALGFSGHAYTSIDTSFCMSQAQTREYIREIKRLREKYSDKIRLYIGLEADLYTDDTDFSDFDYVIGSVHYIKCDQTYVSVDEPPSDYQKYYIDRYCGGSFIGFAEAYYENVTKIAERLRPSLIGHFDLVTKFNEDDCLFSTSDPRYVKAWQTAADALLKLGVPFEINTGAIARNCRITPYPSLEIAKYITERGGSFVLSSDCHNKDFLSCKFEDALKIYSNCRIIDFEDCIKNSKR